MRKGPGECQIQDLRLPRECVIPGDARAELEREGR